jgi:hypothetical protein
LLIASPLFAQNHIIIGWNDLGMHCANQDFSIFVVLPPFNNVHAQVIQVGDSLNPPQVVTSNLRVTYEIPGNTYSVGKTNFWDYDVQLFGVDLPANVGLTGNGLTGEMTPVENYFVATGIPITPYTDADLVHEDPFQLGLLKLYDQSDQLLATAPPVVPVSNEINCVSSGCHASAMAILNQHDGEGGFDPNNRPILCATCHASNALGTPGRPGLPSLSQAVHEHHGDITNDCYKCHPGPNTQCLRDIMSTQHGMVCQDCHGSVSQVGHSIDQGRIPWLQEPSCGSTQCHGSQYAEEPGKLFRQSRGHGGLFCSACHGEPHAIVTSRVARDNVENIALQGYAGTLNRCQVCHGVMPSGPGPHGLISDHPPVLANIPAQTVPAGGHLGVRITATDADGNPITLTAQQLPTHASFTDSTSGIGGLIFNPDTTQAGSYQVRIIAQSTTLADSQLVNITVTGTGSGCSYVIGDVNNSAVFNGIDVSYSVGYFKGGPVPPYSCFCDGSTWYVAGDVNGNCIFNGIDVSFMVSYFKGGAAPIPCPSCPPQRMVTPSAPSVASDNFPKLIPAKIDISGK